MRRSKKAEPTGSYQPQIGSVFRWKGEDGSFHKEIMAEDEHGFLYGLQGRQALSRARLKPCTTESGLQVWERFDTHQIPGIIPNDVSYAEFIV